jgi:hypothetical protein
MVVRPSVCAVSLDAQCLAFMITVAPGRDPGDDEAIAMTSCADPGCSKPGSAIIYCLGRTRRSCHEHKKSVTAALYLELGWVPDEKLGWVPADKPTNQVTIRHKELR